MIDLDHMPPDWKFAQNHAKALKPGLVDSIHTQHTQNVYCKCCLKPIIKNEVSLWSNSKQLQFLGFGFPLYFIFLKYCIILLLILICSYSSISLYWAIKDNHQFCNSSHRLLSGSAAVCTSFMIRFAHIQSSVSETQMVLRLTSFILHIATLIYIRDHIQKTKQYYDEKTTTFSDYSLIFKNLPLVNNIQKKIKTFIKEHFAEQWKQLSMKYSGEEFKKQKVVQITLIPHTQQFYHLIDQKKLLIEEKRKIIIAEQKKQKQNHHKKQQSNGQLTVCHKHTMDQQLNYQSQQCFPINTKIVQQKIRQKSAQIDNMCHLFQDMASKDVLASEIAIVVLNRQIFKNTILQDVQQGIITKQVLQKYFGQQAGQIQISEAPQPSQIIWQNVNYPLSKRLGRKIIGWGLTLMFLAITTVGFYFLLLLKTNNLLHAIEQHDHKKYKIAVFLVFLSSLLIVFFNKLFMGYVLHIFAHLQKHDNTFEQQFSFGLKYTLGLFFTTALMTLAVEAITFHNFYSHEYGVIQQQSIMFFINAFLIPLIWFVNPWQLFNLAKRNLHKNKKSLTQAEANHIMSDTGYTMGKRYAEIIQTMWFTFLYATLIPFGAFLTIIGISLYYWVDKYNLLRRSSLKNNISGKMAIRSLKLLDFTLILRPLGQLMFDTQMRNGYSTVTIFFIIIGALYFILPMGDILEFFHEQKFNQQQKSFQQVKYMFLQTYQTMHPIFGYKSSKSMLNQIKRRTSKQISLSKLQSTDFIMDKKFNILKIQNRQKIDKLNLNDQSSSLDITLKLIPHKDNDKDHLKSQEKKKQYQNIINSNTKSQNVALSQSQRIKRKKNQIANERKSISNSRFNQGQLTFAQDQFIGETVFKTQKKK